MNPICSKFSEIKIKDLSFESEVRLYEGMISLLRHLAQNYDPEVKDFDFMAVGTLLPSQVIEFGPKIYEKSLALWRKIKSDAQINYEDEEGSADLLYDETSFDLEPFDVE